MRKHTVESAMATIAARSVRNPETGCLEWTGAKNSKGYGHLMFQQRVVAVHRFVYTQAHGNLAGTRHVLHTCDNPACCELSHLQVGSNAQNITDKIVKDRSGKKLNTAQASEIKGMIGKVETKDIASAFGVSTSLVWAMRRGKVWAHAGGGR